MTGWPEALGGVWVPLPLALDGRGAVDLALFAPTLEALMGAGLAGVAACASGGGAGEYADLEQGEWISTLEALSAAARAAELPLVVGVGHADPSVGLARARRAARLEPEALVAPLPDGLCARELPGWAGELSACAPEVALVLAEPPRAPALDGALLEHLRAAAPTVAGLALAGRDEDGFEALRRFEQELALWVPSSDLATGFRRGAVGSIAEFACLSPVGCVDWFARLEGDVQGGLAFELLWQRFVEDRLRPLRERFGATQAALDKALALAGGWWPGTTVMRWPNAALPEPSARALLDQALAAGVL